MHRVGPMYKGDIHTAESLWGKIYVVFKLLMNLLPYEVLIWLV